MSDDLFAEVAEAVARRAAEVVLEHLAGPPEPSRWLDARPRPPTQAPADLTAAGAVPHVRDGGRVFYDRRDLDLWMDDRKAGPRPRPPRAQKTVKKQVRADAKAFDEELRKSVETAGRT